MPDDTPAEPGEPAAIPEARSRRRPAVLLAIGLDAIVVVAAIVALFIGFSPIVLALATILAIAPWAAIIDDQERPRRR